MSGSGDKAAGWVYRGIWGVLTDLLNVPEDPPNTPPGSGEVRSLKPAPGYLRYLKMWFWILAVVFDVCLIGGWIIVCVVDLPIGLIIAPVVWAIAIVPDIIAYIALHLRWDTTWYVITDRAVRIRKGIWIIRESTITFENIQNVEIRQGPVERRFGIANLMIQTAGSGGGAAGAHGAAGGAHGLLQGIDRPEELRASFMARAGLSKSAGLGDERTPERPGLTGAHRRALEEIAAVLRRA